MAVPALVGRRGSGASASSAAAVYGAEARGSIARPWPFGHGYAWLVVLALAIAALFSRVYTTNSLAGEPTPDEYLYGVHARELARAWSSGQSLSLENLGVEGRSVVVESAALSFALSWDPLTAGRTAQALFNALCIPATYIVGRQIRLTRSASAVGALLLMAVPEFQELAWRFWTDSQATFLSLAYLSALVAFIRRPGALSGILGVACLGALLLTKESAAAVFAPFLVLAIVIPLSRGLTRSGRMYAVLATVLALGALAGLAVLLARAPADLARNALLQRTFGAGPLIFNSILEAIPRLPAYSDQLVTLIGPTELGPGLLWATLLGYAWLLAQSVVALVTSRPRLTPWVSGWIAAALVWTPAMVTPFRDVGSWRVSDPWVAVAAGVILVAIGTSELYLRNTRRTGWGLTLLGLVVVALLAERLVIMSTPKVSGAALTFRSLMPIVPLFALVAGGGLWAAAGALALLMPSVRLARPALAIAAAAMLVIFWSPLVRERLSDQPLLGRVADRGADPTTPQGLRVETLVDAQPWLQANLRPTDIILTRIPRELAWYADLGVEGIDNLIDLRSQQRTEEEKRKYILDRVGPHGVAYVVDFNVNWTDPNGDVSRQWRQTYETLASWPNLETAYLVRDRFGHPVFYVLRNHGYAVNPAR
jgi:hypothetical protein